MDKNWRPPVHVVASVIVVTFLAASLFDGELVKCPISPAAADIALDVNFYFTHTGIQAVPGTTLNTISQPRALLFLSYEEFPSFSKDLINHAKLSFIFEIVAGYMIMFTIIGALAPSTFSTMALKVMATLAASSAIISAVFNSVLIGDAGKLAISDFNPFGMSDMLGFTAPPIDIGTCVMARGGIYAWVAASLWLLVFLDGWRSMRK